MDGNFAKRNGATLNLLAAYSPILARIASQPGKYKHAHLRAAAVLSLCKFLALSSDYCEAHLQLLFSLLRHSSDSRLKANLIIALGDLAFRFPNTLEPWSPHMYTGLSDSDSVVRKHTLLVLTHLILNDMLKVRDIEAFTPFFAQCKSV